MKSKVTNDMKSKVTNELGLLQIRRSELQDLLRKEVEAFIRAPYNNQSWPNAESVMAKLKTVDVKIRLLERLFLD